MTTKSTEIIKINMAEYGLEENKAAQIEALYVPMIAMLSDMEEDFNHVVKKQITEEVSIEARELRLKIAKVRIAGDKARVSAKDESLRIGKAIQGAYNTLEFATKSKEEKLLAIEKHQERIEEERKDELEADRKAALEPFGFDNDYVNLRDMEQDVWENFLNGVKSGHEQKIAAEKKAEEDRIAAEKAEILERERMREQLALETKAREEAEAKAEKQRLEAEKERKSQQQKADKLRMQQEVELEKERKEKQRIADILKAKEDAEAKAEKKREAEERRAGLAPDKKKLEALIIQINGIEMPLLSNDGSIEIIEKVRGLLAKVTDYIIRKNEQL